MRWRWPSLIVYVVPYKLHPPDHRMMLLLPSTLNWTTVDGLLTRSCSPEESLYELAANAPWTGEPEDVVVVGRVVATGGEVAGDVARIVAGDEVDGAPDDEVAHDAHVTARMITTAGNRTMNRRSDIRPWFHLSSYQSSVASEIVQICRSAPLAKYAIDA